jgi:VIT1/CCC1 family predicted Fe2+/Mn2+ transporter
MGVIEDQHGAIQTQYAAYTTASQVGDEIKKTSELLRPLRSKTQPVEESHEVTNQILNAKNLSVIQTALFSVLFALLTFLFVPSGYAPMAAFLTLCVGASVGIYLSTR